MCPQFVDFDADGYTDIVTATFEGHAFLVRGSGEGWQQPEHILDGQGRKIALSLYYDTEANKYDNVDRSPEGTTNANWSSVTSSATSGPASRSAAARGARRPTSWPPTASPSSSTIGDASACVHSSWTSTLMATPTS